MEAFFSMMVGCSLTLSFVQNLSIIIVNKLQARLKISFPSLDIEWTGHAFQTLIVIILLFSLKMFYFPAGVGRDLMTSWMCTGNKWPRYGRNKILYNSKYASAILHHCIVALIDWHFPLNDSFYWLININSSIFRFGRLHFNSLGLCPIVMLSIIEFWQIDDLLLGLLILLLNN